MKKLVRKAEGGVAMTPITQNMQLAPMVQQSQQLQPITNGFDVSQLIQGFTNGQGGIGQKIGQGLSSALQGTKFAQSGFTNFMNSAKGGLATTAVNLATSFLPGADYSGAKREALAKGLDKGYDAIMSGAAMIPGVGTAVSGIMAAGKFLTKGLDSLGVGTDRMTTADAILDSPFAKLTPFGLINAFGAKKTDTFEADEEANEEVGASYQGSLDTFEDAGDVSGKKYGLFSRRKMKQANEQIAEAQRQQDIVSDISEEAQNAELASNNPFLQNRQQLQRTGGFKAAAVGEKGMKLDNNNLKWANMLLKRMAQAQNTSMMYKDGGKLNIIPTGALHKELHHIDNDNITRKGIPVVTKDENGEIDQQAEVEREELIFNSELSSRLEELRDKYNSSEDESTKDSIAIEAGKIIADELLHNTIDKGKLIKSVQ